MKSLKQVPCAVAVLMSGAVIASLPASAAETRQLPPNGRAIYDANCAACHGSDGRGMRTPAQVGFDLPLPNFSDCRFGPREASADWSAIVHEGGPVRAFSRLMPAFGDVLSDDEIDAVIAHLRTFCTDARWPRGEFNVPLALFTEKAFPEDEFVWRSAFAVEGPTDIESVLVYEKRFGPRSQLEVALPFAVSRQGTGTQAGIGDIGLAWKQVLHANIDTGFIFSVLGETVFPTGSEGRGLGGGSFVFEGHALFAKLFANDVFIQGQVFAGFPARSSLSEEVGLRMVFGKTFAENNGWGRAWSPMLEVLGVQELATGAKTEWDIVPQVQVTLSTRQHVRLNMGARIPVTEPSDRSTLFVFYVLWDWYDAGLFQGW
jgi:mono/diheme cytochrome c family protein